MIIIKRYHFLLFNYLIIKKLSIFNHLNDPFIKESNKEIYDKNQDYYIKRMNWINEYMNSKSFEEIIFRKPEDFDISSEDYDYYCAPKTELQYYQEEQERNKKIGPATPLEKTDPEEPNQ